jgi:phage shock protein E
MKSVVAALSLAFTLTACATTSSGGPAAPGGAEAIAATGIAPGLVDGAAAHKLVAAGIKVVDVRTPAEFADGHVPGAANIPFDEMPKRFAELGPATTPVLVYCKSGRRAGLAIETLTAKGFARIYNLQAYERWVQAER